MTNHQFWAPRESGGWDRPRNVQLWAIVGTSNGPWPWPWPLLGSRSHQHTHYVQHQQTVEPCDCSVTHYQNMAIWISWNVDILRSLNSRDSFRRRKFKNRALTSCRTGPILSAPTISFELHAKVAEEIDLEIRSYGQLSELQMLCDLYLDLGSDQGHINIHSTCRTSSVRNHVTVASRTTKIWPFEFREISTFDEVWTLVIAFVEGNSKIGLRQAVVQFSYYGQQPVSYTHLTLPTNREV